MCELCDNDQQIIDTLLNRVPVAMCSNCLTAFMMFADPQDELVGFFSGHVYRAPTVGRA